MIEENRFNKIEEAIEAFKNGEMIIVADDKDRENEGDLIVNGEFATAEKINFMVTYCKGLVCMPIDEGVAKRLELTDMVNTNTDVKQTAFTQSIDADPKYGVTTGISAFDRAKTIEVVMNEKALPCDLRRPGHIFPLIAKKAGVLQRAGHTEAAVDLAKLCGLKPVNVICEILKEDGTMARRDDLFLFAKKYNFKFITVEDLIKYRMKMESVISKEAVASLPTQFGTFKIIGYKNKITGNECVALLCEDNKFEMPIVRVHSECLTGDVFHSLRCDCGTQLHQALRMIKKRGFGALVYMTDHEGRGIGLINKIKAYSLQDRGKDTVEANIALGFKPDLRDYGYGAQILVDLGFKEFDLITNNPTKIVALQGFGLNINKRIAMRPDVNECNEKYLHTKVEKMQHMIEFSKG